MADVRSLLRQERAARQQSGKPQKHSAAPAAAPMSRKRKAADYAADERKRTRTQGAQAVPADFFDAGDADGGDAAFPPTDPHTAQQHKPQTEDKLETPPVEVPAMAPPQPPARDEDDEDLDAFMNSIPEPPAVELFSGPTIEAAPMTAAEVAAQARQDQSDQRGKRDEELQEETEEAQHKLEDEFDEMESLEERVRRLREKREQLRISKPQSTTADVTPPEPEPANNDDGESDSEDEEWDDWRFGPA